MAKKNLVFKRSKLTILQRNLLLLSINIPCALYLLAQKKVLCIKNIIFFFLHKKVRGFMAFTKSEFLKGFSKKKTTPVFLDNFLIIFSLEFLKGLQKNH